MKLFSADVETTGLRPDLNNKILEIGLVFFDDTKPVTDKATRKYFHAYVWPGDNFTCNIFALDLNKEIISRLCNYASNPAENKLQPSGNGLYSPVLTYDELVPAIVHFIRVECGWSGSVPYIGKNFTTFDLEFLKAVPGFTEKLHWIQRLGDIASLYKKQEDKKLPNLKMCMDRSGLFASDREVPHRGLDDADIVADLWVHAQSVKIENENKAWQLDKLIENAKYAGFNGINDLAKFSTGGFDVKEKLGAAPWPKEL